MNPRNALTVAAMSALLTAPASAQATRDPWKWPFAATSIWNTPIGSNAQWADAGLTAEYWGVGADREFFERSSPADPIYDLNQPPSSGGWYKGSLPFAPDFTLGFDVQTNDCVNALQTDGRTVWQINIFQRPNADTNMTGYRYDDNDLFGDGMYGSHGGSSLSGIGGSVRAGELTGGPIRHALKLELPVSRLSYVSGDATPGYRWPARNTDGNAANDYTGSNPGLVEGALLAVPANVTESGLGLTTPEAKALFHALQDYGGYIVDSTAGGYAVCMEDNVYDGLVAAYGSDYARTGAYASDMTAVIGALKIVTNNGPNSQGGGGVPRVGAPIPPFAYGVRKNLASGTVIEAEDYNVGGEGVGYHDYEGGQLGAGSAPDWGRVGVYDAAAYRLDGVDIRPCAEGGAQVGWTASGDWMKYDVTVTGGTYRVNVRVASGAGGGSLHLEDENGVNLTGSLSVPNTGGWDTFTTVSAANVSLPGGPHTYRLVIDQGGFDLNWWSVTDGSSAGMGVNVAQGKTAAASSIWDSNYDASKAVDGSTSTGWSASGTDTAPWLEVDLGQAYTLSQVQVVTRQDIDQPETRRGFEVWASNNADMSQGHVVLGSQGSTSLPYQAPWSQAVTDTTPYRYLAFVKTDGAYAFVSELRAVSSDPSALTAL